MQGLSWFRKVDSYEYIGLIANSAYVSALKARLIGFSASRLSPTI